MADIPRRLFGNTGLEVSALGLGGGQVGNSNLPEPVAERLLNQTLDLGLNLIDTARGYGQSEARIARYLGRRRQEVVLSTKVGYGVNFEGIAALLGALNSCASNVAVVNIDNGFGAACFATVINRL